MKKDSEQLKLELQAVKEKLLKDATNYKNYVKKYKANREKLLSIVEVVEHQLEEALREELDEKEKAD